MKYIGKITAIIMCMAIVLSIMPVLTKASSIEVTLSADTFIAEGQTGAYIMIYNTSEFDMENISLEVLGFTYNLKDAVIPGYSSSDFEIGNIPVTEDIIGTDIVFTLKWTENGTEQKTSESVHIYDGRVEPVPTETPEVIISELVSFECKAESYVAESGQEVTIIYRLDNDSNETLTDITIMDPGVSDTPIVTGKSVYAGDTFTYRHKMIMGNDNIVTAPIVSYTYSQGINSLRGDEITIECVTVDMTTTVTRKEPDKKGTEFVITLNNNGNKKVSDVHITDIDGEQIENPFDIAPGETKEISYTINPKGMKQVMFNVEGRLATGEKYNYESEIYVVWEYIDPNAIGLEFTVDVAEPINDEGYVGIDFSVVNVGTEQMNELEITQEGVRIGSFKSLEGGGKDSVSMNVFAGEAKNMTFILKAKAPTGEPFEYPVTVSKRAMSFDKDTIVNNMRSSIDVGSAVSGAFMRVLKVIMIVAIAAGGLFIAFVVLEIIRSRQIKNSEGKD